MKKWFALTLAAVMLLCLFTGCDSKAGPGGGADSSTVNLMDLYTVTDPEGVEYDQRVALYKPVLESDEHYADGARESFCVLYGKDGKGVYMYSVETFETQEQAEAYLAESEVGKTDGSVYINETDADFFAAMEAFMPDLQSWIDNMMLSGMMELS